MKTAARVFTAMLSAFLMVFSLPAAANGSEKFIGSGDALPAYVDNSPSKYFPGISNQGYVSAPASFASTYYLATYETARARDWDVKAGNDYILSPAFTYNLANGGKNAATSLEANLRILKSHGAPTWAHFPYSENDYLSWPSDAEVWRSAIGNKIESYGTVETSTEEGLQTLKQMLAEGRILAFETSKMDWVHCKVKDNRYPNQRAVTGSYKSPGNGDAMAIVGYDDNFWVLDDEKGALKIAAPYGTSFFNGGYVWVSYDALKNYQDTVNPGIIYKNKAYWLEARASYTPLMTADITLTTARRDQLTLYYGANRQEAGEPCACFPEGDGSPGSRYTYDPAITGSGGPYSFAATIVLDLTDCIHDAGFDTEGGALSFAVGVLDSGSGYSQSVNGVTFTDVRSGKSFKAMENMPAEVDDSLKWFCGKEVLNPEKPATPYSYDIDNLTEWPESWHASAVSEGGEGKEWRFTPSATGRYTFSSDTPATSLEIQNGARQQLYLDIGSDAAPAIKSVMLYSGKTYVLRAWTNNSAPASFNLMLMRDELWEETAQSASLQSLTSSAGEMRPAAFDRGIKRYNISLGENEESTTITAAPEDLPAYMTIDGAITVRSEHQLGKGESKTCRIEVTSADWTKTEAYTLVISRALSSDARLSDISLSGGSSVYELEPGFDSDVSEYSVHLPEGAGSVHLYATAADGNAMISIDGVREADCPLWLDNGESRDVAIDVKAQDSTSAKKYTLHVNRMISSNAFLSGINVSSGELAPEFSPEVYQYSIRLKEGNDLTLAPVKADDNATVFIDGENLSDKTYAVAPDSEKTAEIRVVSQDQSHENTYYVRIGIASNNADLSWIDLSAGSLAPSFKSDICIYSVKLNEAQETVSIEPVKSDDKAVVLIDGHSTENKTIKVKNGEKVDVAVDVTAEDGINTKTYGVAFIRAKSTNALLSGISLSAGSINSAFNPFSYRYTISLSESDRSTTITPQVQNEFATVFIDGAKVPGKTVSLDNGKSTRIKIKVISQNGKRAKTYIFKISRPRSTNNDLAGLAASAGTLEPAFDPAITAYTLALDENMPAAAISAEKAHPLARLTMDGRKTGSKIYKLAPGASKTAVVRVRSQAGTTKTYTVTITRAKSTNADLSIIRTNSKRFLLHPTFDRNTFEYSIMLPTGVHSVKLYAVKDNKYAAVLFNGAKASSKKITLRSGQTAKVIITVIAQAGNFKTYTVHITAQ
ncbi:MAG: cadherin-like beta sandwich domain-containing protein [Bacillota bacterium]|nr:cadherin-like beta sandwich domain-containing protein [Bacillota bacterium]